MISDNDMLNNIRKGTQMGCFGIDRVIGKTADDGLRRDLTSQRAEYQQIYAKADQLLSKNGGKRVNISPIAKMSTGMMSAMQTMVNRSPSKIAEMMITGNTMGVTKSLRNLHNYHGGSRQVEQIAEKLLETEENNIKQMQVYL